MTMFIELKDGLFEGVLKTVITRRQFGFISGDDGREIFVHQDNCVGYTLKLGDRVQYDIGPAITLGRPDMAINVRLGGGAL
jgi:cold shock CspA family protein